MTGTWIQTHWGLIETLFLVLVYLLSIYVGGKVITQTTQPAKALAYLMVLFFLPGIGLLIYLGIGENRRVNKIYDRKLFQDLRRYKQVKTRIVERSLEHFRESPELLSPFSTVIHLLLKDLLSPLTMHNEVELLINGEEKFPAVLDALRQARHHIHLEYYIFEKGIVGDAIREVLIEKARAGVEVRFVYDDFGSQDLRRSWLKEMQAAGVQAYPFYRIRLFANRLNYRNHRKIIVIDGKTAFVGGINISDRYSNDPDRLTRLRSSRSRNSGRSLGRAPGRGRVLTVSRGETGKGATYWRDTHLRIRGSAVRSLQYLFLSDWSFASGQDVDFREDFFPRQSVTTHTFVQIASSGPDSLNPTIMLANNTIIHNARKYVYITTPYFIPNDSVFDAVRTAALGGLDVRILVPYRSDSWLVNMAASAYYDELLAVGVKFYRYRRGFIHAKTLVVDDQLGMVGSANMDNRSFELNFETNAIIYDQVFAVRLRDQFLRDLEDSDPLDEERWNRRGRWRRFLEAIARLLSGVL